MEALSNAARAPLREPKRIGRMLIDEGLIEPQHLKEALELQRTRGGKTVELLIYLGYLDLDRVSTFLATRPGVASIDLHNYTVPRELCALVPREFATRHEVFPLDHLGNHLTVAMAFPIDLHTIQELENSTGLRISALLCSASDIRNAIRRYYPAEGAPAPNDGQAIREMIGTRLRIENVVSVVRQIDSLPTLPRTVERVQEAMADPETSLRDIAEIVSGDPPIAARLLQLANSAAYGFLSRINSVQSAITLLGMRETYMAVLSSAVLDATHAGKGFDHERYWRASLFCAGAARKIAVAAGHARNPAAFTAGLLCDIGQFALSQVAATRYASIDPVLDGLARVEAEEAALGIGHAEAGHILAVHWKLPDDIAAAIRFHHRPDLATEHGALVGITALAARMSEAHLHNAPAEESTFELDSALLELVGVDTAGAADVYAAARAPETTDA
jgi:HD-like signal output (HDOD) protein